MIQDLTRELRFLHALRFARLNFSRYMAYAIREIALFLLEQLRQG